MTRRLQDSLVSSASIGGVVAGVAVIDDTCRRFLLNTFRGEFPTLPPLPSLRIAHITSAIGDTLGIPAGTQEQVLLFAALGVLLCVGMFRS